MFCAACMTSGALIVSTTMVPTKWLLTEWKYELTTKTNDDSTKTTRTFHGYVHGYNSRK